MREPGRHEGRTFPLTRGSIVGIVATCVMLASAVWVVGYLGTGNVATGHLSADGRMSRITDERGHANRAADLLPGMVVPPQGPLTPRSAPPSSGTSPGSHAAPPLVTSGSPTCPQPQFMTSTPSGMWNLAPYFVANNMWNASSYSVSQTLYACSSSNWYVAANMNNDSGDGAVKTYPNSHRDFASKPEISSFRSITSTFAETSPDTGTYEDAYDIWVNGIASSSSTEVMVWNESHHQVPCGSVVGSATFGGRVYTVWRVGNYIAFAANQNFTSGTVNLLQMLRWVMARGWMPASSTLSQVDYGVALVSTDGAPATFTFSNFAVNAN